MQEECRGWGWYKLKALVTAKTYPLNVTSTLTFNINNKDWSKLKGRVNFETDPSLSSVSLLYPPGGAVRDIEVYYNASCKSDIPGVPIAEIEKYDSSNPIKSRLGSTTDKWVNFPLNTYKAGDFSYSPSDIYGVINTWVGKQPYIDLGSSKWTEDYAKYTINPSWRTPIVSNIAINQTDARLPMTVTWDSTIQDAFDIETWQDGIKKYSTSGGVQKNATIPAKILGLGEFDIKIVSANNPIDDLGVTGTATARFTATNINPTATNLKVNQLEPRLPILLSWESTNQTDFKADIIQNGTLKRAITGTSNDASIPPNTVTDGVFTVNLYSNNTIGGTSSTVLLTGDFIASIDKPLITSLEPDEINNNVNLPILCTWSASRQESYALKLIQDNQILKIYTGTTAQQLNIPPDTFKTGNCKLELAASNIVNGTTATSTKVSEFLGYGRPKTPIFNEQNIFNQALPTFKWESYEQIAYIFEIWKDNIKIEGTQELIGTNQSYTTESALENNSIFTIKVKVKNQFNLWSDFAIKEITVSYTELPKPEFDIARDSSGILITMLMEDTPGLATLEVWRKDDYSKWTRFAYDMKRNDQWTDDTVASGKNYYYKVIANAKDGGMSESEVKTEKAIVMDFVFVNIEEPINRAVLKWNPKISITNMRKITSRLFAGCTKPKIEKGNVKYKIARMEFTITKPELEYFQYLADTSKVILFRDRRGEKIYGQISSDISENYEMLNKVNISFEFTELNFIEKDIHKGSGGIFLTFFNGAWKFDGSIDFSGSGVL